MKKPLLIAVMIAATIGTNPRVVSAQSFGLRMIEAYEAGARTRAIEDQAAAQRALADYYRQQAELLRLRNQQLATQEQAIQRQAQIETKAIIDQFTLKYPGWQKYEQRMLQYAQKIQPKGLDDFEYMEVLYFLATKEDRERAIGEAAKKESDRTITEFTVRHPDWQQFEKVMLEVANQLQPKEGMTSIDYMEALYAVAKSRKP